MAITNMPVFEEGEILTAGKLNQLVAAIEAKFNGAVGGGDISWPVTAEGNLDMSGFSILGLRRLWNVFNSDEYSTLQAAVDAVEAAGGGALFIVPNGPITADGITVEISDILIFGAGNSSQVKLTGGASSGFMFRTGAGSLANITFANLQLDGQSTGTAQKGVIARRVDNFRMDSVTLKNFTGDFIYLTNDGTPGNACTDASITNVLCTGGSAAHLTADDIDGLDAVNFRSKSAGTDSVKMEPTAAGCLVRNITINGLKSRSAVGKGCSILGQSATPGANFGNITVTDSQVISAGGDCFEIGEASKILRYVHISGNQAHDSAADAFVVNASGGVVSNNHGYSAAGDGIDLVASVDLLVIGNSVPDAGAYGIDAEGTTDCRVLWNEVSGAVTEGVRKDTASGLLCGGNIGDTGVLAGTTFVEHVGQSHTGDTNETTMSNFTRTIPGHTMVGEGSWMRITVAGTKAGAGGTCNVRVKVGATITGTFALNNASTSAYTGVLYVMINSVGITGASNAEYWTAGLVSATADNVEAGTANATLDFAADTNITVTVQLTSAGDTANVDFMVVEFFHGIAG